MRARSRTRVISAALLAVLMVTASFANLFVMNGSARADSPEVIITGPQDQASARQRANDVCNGGDQAGFGAWPSDISFNASTGHVDYTMNLTWRLCNSWADTRAYAVTGYPTNGLNVCPMAGDYYMPNWTYDCVKYVGPSERPFRDGNELNCVRNGEWDNYGDWCFSSDGINQVRAYGNQPSTDWSQRSYRFSGDIPAGLIPGLSGPGAHEYTYGGYGFICQYYKLKIGRRWDTGSGGGACQNFAITVKWMNYDYSLSPTITNITDNGTVSSGKGSIPVTGNVYNNGPTDSKSNAEWQLTQLVYKPSVTPSNRGGGDDGNDPCRYFTGSDSCTKIDGGIDSTAYTRNAGRDYDRNGNVGDLPVGSLVCFAMSVKPYSHATTDWRHSKLYCLIVSKSPKVTVMGGDLFVGRKVGTNAARTSDVVTSVTSVPDSSGANKYYGSWSEYGILASGLVNGMASGAGYASGSPSKELCTVSLLTVANATASGCIASSLGGYKQTVAAPEVGVRFPINSTTAALPSAAVDIMGNNLSGLYTTSASAVTVKGGGQLPAKRWVVINAPSATVTINGDIQYTNASFGSVTDIPQVVIIARNIIIADNVTNVDAWLVASGAASEGRLNTCGAGAVSETTALNAGLCNQKLTVNGPVVANHLILRRTAGSGTGAAAGDPAEVFNLRADAYIWASSYSPGTGRLPTVSTKELPPRF